MFRLVIVTTLLLSIVQNQVYFHCNFDENKSPCKLFSNGTNSNLHIETFHIQTNLSDNPIVPLSDVTAIQNPCQIPYRIDDNSKDIYFCTNLTGTSNRLHCLTKDRTIDECRLGKYAIVKLESMITYTYYIKLTNVMNRLSLSFYYFLTRSNVGTINIRDSENHQIGRISHMLYNGWNYAKFNFQPTTRDYYIYFELQRNEVEHQDEEFHIALDEIMIVESTITARQLPPSDEKEISPRYQCDFSTSCFPSDRTDGSEFNPSIFFSQKAPTSDVTSIHQPTSDNQHCQLPYQINKKNVWFCYDHQCPTNHHEHATCSLGYYGLISIEPHEKSKTIMNSLKSSIDKVQIEQCLRFFYYLSLDEQRSNWGQQIQVWIRTENRFLLSNLTLLNMTDNKWEFNEVTFNVISNNYTLEFVFERGDDGEFNETIYFALDNLEVYDYNCSYLKTLEAAIVSTSTTIIATTTIKGDQRTVRSTFPPNWGLIISLTLGLGVSIFGLLIGLLIYHLRVKRRIAKARSNSTHSDIPLNPRGYPIVDDNEPIETYYF